MLLLLEAWLLLKPPAFKSCKPLQRDRSKSISRLVQAITVLESRYVTFILLQNADVMGLKGYHQSGKKVKRFCVGGAISNV
jgi:hypothetical protein